ncbi:MAG: hypothetical protein ACJ790_22555 [Myxococcaceae bacterium]
MPTDRRWVMVPAIVGGVLGGLFYLNHDFSPIVSAVCVVGGAVLSGILDGTSARNRLVAIVAWSLGAFCALATLLVYVHYTGRTHLNRLELILPVVVGAAPIFLVRQAAEKGWLERVPSQALGVAALALVALPLVVAVRMENPGTDRIGDSGELVLTLTHDQVLYQGIALSESELQNLIRGRAIIHPGSSLKVVIARGADPREAIDRILGPASRNGLVVSSVEE